MLILINATTAYSMPRACVQLLNLEFPNGKCNYLIVNNKFDLKRLIEEPTGVV